MNRYIGAFLLAGLIGTAQNAVAEEKGNLHLFPSLAWATQLPDEQLADRRGGFGTVAFSVAFAGMVDNLGNLQGFLNVNPGNGTALGSPTVTTDPTGTQATVTAQLGGPLGNGIFQLTQVPGSFNVVNNTLVVQIALITVASPGQIPANPLSLFSTLH
jgi:hypothetical protein